MLKREIRSFGYAFKGLKSAFANEPHLRFHLLAAILVTIAGFCFQLSKNEWIAIVICITVVFTAELFNTALEKLVDLVSPEYNKTAGLVKDVAAAAVLVCSIGAAVVGVIVFWEKIFN